MALPVRDCYFVEWLQHFELDQKDVVNGTGWNKSKASLFFKGDQRFHRDDIFTLADFLQIEPHELLMPPEKAMSLRRIQAELKRIAGEPVLTSIDQFEVTDQGEPKELPDFSKTGTDQ